MSSSLSRRKPLIQKSPYCFFCKAKVSLVGSHASRRPGSGEKTRYLFCGSCHRDFVVRCWLNAGRVRNISKFRRLLWEEDSRCWYCLSDVAYTQATIDHVVPLANKGPSVVDNLVLACRDCNQRKGNKHLNHFLRELRHDIRPRRRLERLAGMFGRVFRSLNRCRLPAPVGNIPVSSLWPDREDQIYQRAARCSPDGASAQLLRHRRSKIIIIREGRRS